MMVSSETSPLMAITALSHGPGHNRPTQYEVEVVIWGREPIIAGYTARKTKASLLAVAMQNNLARWHSFTPDGAK